MCVSLSRWAYLRDFALLIFQKLTRFCWYFLDNVQGHVSGLKFILVLNSLKDFVGLYSSGNFVQMLTCSLGSLICSVPFQL